MTKDECRQLFIDKGLSYKDINLSKIHELKELLIIELLEFHKTNPHIDLKFKKTGSKGKGCKFNEDGSVNKYFLMVSGSYFNDREAISFNQDGFIGFAGWADSTNVSPMLNAFEKWVEEII